MKYDTNNTCWNARKEWVTNKMWYWGSGHHFWGIRIAKVVNKKEKVYYNKSIPVFLTKFLQKCFILHLSLNYITSLWKKKNVLRQQQICKFVKQVNFSSKIISISPWFHHMMHILLCNYMFKLKTSRYMFALQQSNDMYDFWHVSITNWFINGSTTMEMFLRKISQF